MGRPDLLLFVSLLALVLLIAVSASSTAHQCRKLSHVKNAHKTCIQGTRSFRRMCVYRCEEGSKFKGGSRVRICRCNHQGVCKWSGKHTRCQGKPPTITPPATTTPPVDRCSGRSGKLPESSAQTPLSFTRSNDSTKYDYNELLYMSLLFYESQRSGYQPNNNRIPWRGDSGLHDGCDVGHDLTGGFHDAGDHVKFGFPMAASTTVLAWGMIMFKDAYVDAGEWKNALSNLKWATDYFLKAHTKPYELYGQVGRGGVDHSNWGRPEEQTIRRPSYKINATHPGSDLAGETSAALAASSIIFKAEGMTKYAKELLRHSKQLYNFADTYRGFYHDTITDAGDFYSSYDFKDEIVWACLWLYKATGSHSRLYDCTRKYNSFHFYYVPHEFSWSSKNVGINVLMAEITKLRRYRDIADKFVEYARDDVPRTPGGLAYFSKWGSNRYAANAAFIALATAATTGTRHADDFIAFARQQIYCLLGDGDNHRSYVVGFGNNPPTEPHHRSSSCPAWTANDYETCDWGDFHSSDPNPHTLYGALIGGPSLTGHFSDNRTNYVTNEVSTDYNAGFQSAIAGLKHFVILDRSDSESESESETGSGSESD